MKSRIDELLMAKAKMNEDLEMEKASRASETNELHRQLKDMTES